MLLNCGVGEDSWESLGLQGDPTSPSQRKSVLNIHWKDWCWSWNANTLATWCEELTYLKTHFHPENELTRFYPDAGKDWRQEEKGITDDEMVGWHHWPNEHEFEQAPGVGDGQGSPAYWGSWGCRVGHKWAAELSWTEELIVGWVFWDLCFSQKYQDSGFQWTGGGGVQQLLSWELKPC